jgi:ankyrin repeat protein
MALEEDNEFLYSDDEFLYSEEDDEFLDSDEDEIDVFYHCKHGNLIEIIKYLNEGFEVESKNQEGETLLEIATWSNYIHIIDFLIETCKVNINSRDNGGYTPLLNASLQDNTASCTFLLNNGAEVNFENLEGNTPLIFASKYGNNEYVELLINKYGADIDHVNKKGLNALITASIMKNLNVIKILLENGADYKIKDNKGNTIFNYLTGDLLLEVNKIMDTLNFDIKPAKC